MKRTLAVFVTLCLTLVAGCGVSSPAVSLSTPTIENIATLPVAVTLLPAASPAIATLAIQPVTNLDASATPQPLPAATSTAETATAAASESPLTPTPSPASMPVSALTITQLKYKLIDRFGAYGATPGIFFCDPDQFPLARAIEPGQVAKWFIGIDKSDQEYQGVLEHMTLPAGGDLSAGQQLQVYQEYKLLNAIILTPAGDSYHFGLRVSQGGAAKNGSGLAIAGDIDPQGDITIQTQQPARLMCPICLAVGTRIDTPSGPIPVEDLRPGIIVWTVTRTGMRIAAPVVETAHTPVPADHQVIHLQLEDGRQLRASAGHPTADGHTLGDLAPGDWMDGARVVSALRESYAAPETYDLLPAGDTGFYWADGILVGSTLSQHSSTQSRLTPS